VGTIVPVGSGAGTPSSEILEPTRTPSFGQVRSVIGPDAVAGCDESKRLTPR
jgi:hypothetical protein